MTREYVPFAERMKVMGPMFLAGRSRTEIAEACGVTAACVDGVKKRAVEAGRPVGYGDLARSMSAQDASFRKWVIDNTPEGSAPADFLTAIALDVYHEEVDE
ncbi:MAG: hypothetical protein ABNH26_08610 [Celeribacter sp.]|jgi:hypothetical protein